LILHGLKQELQAAIQEYTEQIAAVADILAEHPGDKEAQQVRATPTSWHSQLSCSACDLAEAVPCRTQQPFHLHCCYDATASSGCH
jgi:hypothetical protein